MSDCTEHFVAERAKVVVEFNNTAVFQTLKAPRVTSELIELFKCAPACKPHTYEPATASAPHRTSHRILIREQTTDAISFLSLLSQLGRERGGSAVDAMRRV